MWKYSNKFFFVRSCIDAFVGILSDFCGSVSVLTIMPWIVQGESTNPNLTSYCGLKPYLKRIWHFVISAHQMEFNMCDSGENQTNINQREINLHTLLSPISRRQQLEDQPSLYCITQVYLICKYLQIFVICHSAMLQILAINNFFSTSNTFG